MQDTGYSCPGCGARDVKRFEQYEGFKLSCRSCSYVARSCFSRVFLRLNDFLRDLI